MAVASLYLRVLIGSDQRYAKAVCSPNGNLKPNQCLIDGKPQRFADGVYPRLTLDAQPTSEAMDWCREGGRLPIRFDRNFVGPRLHRIAFRPRIGKGTAHRDRAAPCNPGGDHQCSQS